MKKYYFIVLTALLTFALNLNAQENEEQETYNMTVTLPDGTTVTVNTEDVNEITFANGKLNVTGTSIDEIVQKLRQALCDIEDNRNRFYNVLERSEIAQKSADAAQASADAAQASADRAIKEAQDACMTAADAKMMAEDATYHSANVEVKVAELENKVEVHDASLQALSDRELALTEEVANLKLENNDLKTVLVDMMWFTNNLEARLAALEEVVNSMKE